MLLTLVAYDRRITLSWFPLCSTAVSNSRRGAISCHVPRTFGIYSPRRPDRGQARTTHVSASARGRASFAPSSLASCYRSVTASPYTMLASTGINALHKNFLRVALGKCTSTLKLQQEGRVDFNRAFGPVKVAGTTPNPNGRLASITEVSSHLKSGNDAGRFQTNSSKVREKFRVATLCEAVKSGAISFEKETSSFCRVTQAQLESC